MKVLSSPKARPPRKIPYILLTILLMLSIAPDTTDSAAALDDAARWSRVYVPTEGEAGKWALAEGSDVRCLKTAADGTLYAAVIGLDYTLYRSVDGGVSWSHIGNVRDEIIDIAVSPHEPGMIYYATTSNVYRSTDSGTHFYPISASPGGAGADDIEITSIDVTWYDCNIIAAGTRDTETGEFGDVYLLNEDNAYSGWTPTNIGDYDVYAVAFSPNYPLDFQLIAIVTDETDTFSASRSGSMEWNALTGIARFSRDNTGEPVVVSESASVAFPDNYESSCDSPNYVYYAGIDTGTGEGDVYSISCNFQLQATATDLNAGYTYGYGNVDITGLAAAGSYPDVSLLAGASGSPQVYRSSNGGKNWETSRKPPTGETGTCVLMSPDFTTSGLAYAASSGTDSAFSVSRDGGNTWNQSSLIDDIITAIIDMAPAPRYDDDATLFLITYGNGHSLWRSRNGGNKWERVFSTQIEDADIINRVSLPPEYGNDCRTVFVAGEINGQAAIWKSTDDGQDYRHRGNHDPITGAAFVIDAWVISDENTLFAGGYDGTNGIVYKTINSGFFYSQAVTAGNQPLYSLALSPDYQQDRTILAGNTNGGVYWSENDGGYFQSLPPGADSPPLTGAISVAFDPGFAKNRVVYAASDTADSGIYRFVIGDSDKWEQITGTLPAGTTFGKVAVSSSGVLYALNLKSGIGIQRCLKVVTASGTSLETLTSDLYNNASFGGLWLSGSRLWSTDSINNMLLTFNDTLTVPIELIAPENMAPGTGNVIDKTIRNVTIEWEKAEGATRYKWRCDNDSDFSSIPDGLEDTTASNSVQLPALEPATTYYWQVRASSPVQGPWSEKRSFTTTMTAETASLKLEIPSAGASDIPLKPVFQWSALGGANAYELLVSSNANFTSPIIDKRSQFALTSNAWQCDISLDNDTTYYWKVRAISARTNSEWSAAGAFTTEPVPTSETGNEPVETREPLPLQGPEKTPTAIFVQQQAVPPEIQMQPPAPPAESTLPAPLPYSSQPLTLQGWTIYLMGGLVATIMFALIVILVMLLKMRRL